MNNQLQSKQEEIGVLKAKLYLDLLNIQMNVVAEYPDMVDENNELYSKIDIMDEEIRSYHSKIE